MKLFHPFLPLHLLQPRAKGGDSRPEDTGGEAEDSRSETEANSLPSKQERSVEAAGLNRGDAEKDSRKAARRVQRSEIMRNFFRCVVFLAGILVATPTHAEIISATNVTPSGDGLSATLQLSGNTVTISGLMTAVPLVADLSGGNFSAAPLGATAQAFQYASQSQPLITSQYPLTGLLVYPLFFRGTAPGLGVDLPVYVFDRSFSVRSGLTGATILGNAILCPTSQFHSGILRFPGSLNSLKILTNANGIGLQGLTFAIDDAQPTVSGSQRIRISKRKKSVRLTGTAFAPIGIRSVAVKAPGKSFRPALGTENWSFRTRLKERRRTVLKVRAESASSKVSTDMRIKVIRRGN